MPKTIHSLSVQSWRLVLCVCLLAFAGCDKKSSNTRLCGNGQVNEGESCDGLDLDGETCLSRGFSGGLLACGADCRFDETGCVATCGNNVLDPGELCDGDQLDGKTCADAGVEGPGTLACNDDCTWDTSGCLSECGNGVIEDGEQCDDNNTAPGDGCSTNCRIETGWNCTGAPSSCTTTCGDGLVGAPVEACDGMAFGGDSCEARGFYTGILTCSSDCTTIDDSLCSSFCGDGVADIAYGEACDGTDFAGDSCIERGFYTGSLVCSTDCMTIDGTSCASFCGDGILDSNHGEECDGTHLDDETCGSLGYHGGSLACDGNCYFDRSDCMAAGRCGDGVVQSEHESCDGSDLDGETCLTLGYYGGTLTCNLLCGFNLISCMAAGRCGDGVVQTTHGETCDGENMNGTTCQTLGFGPGPLTCTDSCTIDSSGCSSATDVSAGYFHSCAVDNLGTGKCWGSNSSGQLGDNTTTNRHVPVAVVMPTGRTFVQIVAGLGHSCALADNGRVWCWGGNGIGQLGNNTTNQSLIPTAASMPSGRTFTQISLSFNHTCAIADNGTAWCWGGNGSGRLGDNTTTNRSVPTAVVMPSGRTFTRISAGWYRTCAIADNGTAWCWGNNQYGGIGNNSTTDRSVPTAVVMPSGRTFNRIATLQDSSCAIADNGTAWCWGGNDYGQIGDNTTTQRNTPVVVVMPSGRTFTDISGDYLHACVLDNLNAAWCWGLNHSQAGSLGDGTFVSRRVPTAVVMPLGKTFTRMDVGHVHSCAIDQQGAIWCWGYNEQYGALGDGTLTNRNVPTRNAGF